MNAEVLTQLKDVHWPPAPSIWPLAIGYYLVLFLMGAALSWSLYFFVFSRRKRAIKRIINEEFIAIEQAFKADGDVARLQASLVALLRRILSSKKGEVFEQSFGFERACLNLFPHREKTLQMLELLNKERFHKHPNVESDLLLKLLREQLKRCRI